MIERHKFYNITFNTLAPFAASRLTEDVLSPELFQAAKPEFVTPLVMYLVSNERWTSKSVMKKGNRLSVMPGK